MTGRADLEVDTLTISIPMRLQRRGGRKLIMAPEGMAAPVRKPSRDETLVKALVRAHRWRRKIECGQAKSITDLAEQEGVTDAYVCRLLPLTCLAPDVVEAILDGRQQKRLRLAEMLGNGPRVWEEQRSAWVFCRNSVSPESPTEDHAASRAAAPVPCRNSVDVPYAKASSRAGLSTRMARISFSVKPRRRTAGMMLR
jgi:hypothetical protein